MLMSTSIMPLYGEDTVVALHPVYGWWVVASAGSKDLAHRAGSAELDGALDTLGGVSVQCNMRRIVTRCLYLVRILWWYGIVALWPIGERHIEISKKLGINRTDE
jgi:hypothetical protein